MSHHLQTSKVFNSISSSRRYLVCLSIKLPIIHWNLAVLVVQLQLVPLLELSGRHACWKPSINLCWDNCFGRHVSAAATDECVTCLKSFATSMFANTVAVDMQQALQQQAYEAMQQSVNAGQGMPTHNMNQGYFGEHLRLQPLPAQASAHLSLQSRWLKTQRSVMPCFVFSCLQTNPKSDMYKLTSWASCHPDTVKTTRHCVTHQT